MKIAYIAESYTFKYSGVLSKLTSQLKIWNQSGHEAKLLLISLPAKHAVNKVDNMHIFTYKYALFLPKPFRQYANKILSVRSMKQYIQQFSPDVIYYRQSIWYPGLIGCLHQAPYIVELNTYDFGEKKLLPLILRLYYAFGKRFIIKYASGLVSVSEEISKLYCDYGKSLITIANGADFSLKIPSNQQKSDNKKRPQLIFVGSPRQVWQGADKLVSMAEKLLEFDFHLVGVELEKHPENLKSYGYLEKDDLFRLYNKMDIGIGTLSLHKKNMQEASPLKTREYSIFGLPMIVGYNDTDLDGEDFVLNIGNQDNNVIDSIEIIRLFVLKWAGKRINTDRLKKKVGMKDKEYKRLQFMENILV